MSTPLAAVLFDMGGVLVDMRNPYGWPQAGLDYRGREAMIRRLREAGGRATEEDLEQMVFGPWKREYEERYRRGREADWDPHLDRLIAASGAEVDGHELLAAWFRPYGESLRLVEGAVDVLVGLAARGLGLALVSNVPLPGELYRDFLAAWRLAQPFRRLLFSYDEGSRKPSPAMLNAALATLGVEPAAAVMVGDRRDSDVAAGIAAGTRTVWLEGASGDGPRPDAAIASLAELPACLVELERR